MDKEELRKKAIEDTKEDLKDAADRDQYLIKAVKFLEQLERDIGPDMERLRDWYSIHFPELEEEIGSDEEFMEILKRGVHRDELDAFEGLAEESTGAPLVDEDFEVLKNSVENVQDRYDLKNDIEEYVEDGAKETMTNLSKLLGPVLATKLVALQGSLEELAKQPASTIQMLGAEKALFRYLHGEGTPPKHGIIFEHEFVNSLPDDKRGKMARVIANKAAMAARVDQYGDKDKGEELHKEIQEKYRELKE